MKVRPKILVIGLTIFATLSLAFANWFANQQKYEAFSDESLRDFEKSYGSIRDLSDERLSQVEEAASRNLKMTQCLNRYRAENRPFAPAVTACKQEIFLPSQ